MDSGFEHDATATWSGYIYQGYVAIYVALEQASYIAADTSASILRKIFRIFQHEYNRNAKHLPQAWKKGFTERRLAE